MKIKTATGPALDWMVARAAGLLITPVKLATTTVMAVVYDLSAALPFDMRSGRYWQPSTVWDQGGPILDEGKISIAFDDIWKFDPSDPEDNGERWYAELSIAVAYNSYGQYGPTPLIAAMRCYVASKLGDEVYVPEELT